MNHYSSIINLILFITVFSSLSSVSNAWTMPMKRTSGVTSSSSAGQNKFHLLPKRFRNKQSNNNGDAVNTERYFRNGVEDDEETTIITSLTPSQSLQSSAAVQRMDVLAAAVDATTMPVVSTEPSPTIASVRAIDLPKHSPPTNTVRNAKMLWDLELVLGRTAMVAGVLMLVGEVFFGFSPLFSLIGI
eukprot:CAMPEP_0113642406 /NCGR_PEP_ID=MMETSP0017_2-20120614/22278_1 /TAXON_ID=2856 /ORGANISM="Cylindrotheca closterium" /LENGTH=187 /DNA_ID=CAMNT_0000553829 /DNA_START=98 /DNA_END=661 /DNA_ORIENTATION=+ /assembly_acc=CAM_ASM_000147